MISAASDICSMAMPQNCISPIAVSMIMMMAIAEITAVRTPAISSSTTSTTATEETTLEMTSLTFLSTALGWSETLVTTMSGGRTDSFAVVSKAFICSSRATMLTPDFIVKAITMQSLDCCGSENLANCCGGSS